jgi:hypothetical protein
VAFAGVGDCQTYFDPAEAKPLTGYCLFTLCISVSEFTFAAPRDGRLSSCAGRSSSCLGRQLSTCGAGDCMSRILKPGQVFLAIYHVVRNREKNGDSEQEVSPSYGRVPSCRTKGAKRRRIRIADSFQQMNALPRRARDLARRSTEMLIPARFAASATAVHGLGLVRCRIVAGLCLPFTLDVPDRCS